MFSVQKVLKEQQQTSLWSGGTTTQLAIYPQQAQYSQRSFIWRLSSATVEDETSVFTELPDYKRIISVIDGELHLCHNGQEEIVLAPLQQNTFDGANHTKSTGKVKDFNLMMRKGSCSGQMETWELPKESSVLWRTASAGSFDGYTVAVYCAKGCVIAKADLEQQLNAVVEQGELLLFSSENPSVDQLAVRLCAQADSALFLCKIEHKR